MNLKQRAHLIKPTIWLGKNGLSGQQVNETKKQLKSKKLVKVKFLKSALKKKDKKALTEELIKLTDAKLIYRAGFVAVIHKK